MQWLLNQMVLKFDPILQPDQPLVTANGLIIFANRQMMINTHLFIILHHDINQTSK